MDHLLQGNSIPIVLCDGMIELFAVLEHQVDILAKMLLIFVLILFYFQSDNL